MQTRVSVEISATDLRIAAATAGDAAAVSVVTEAFPASAVNQQLIQRKQPPGSLFSSSASTLTAEIDCKQLRGCGED